MALPRWAELEAASRMRLVSAPSKAGAVGRARRLLRRRVGALRLAMNQLQPRVEAAVHCEGRCSAAVAAPNGKGAQPPVVHLVAVRLGLA